MKGSKDNPFDLVIIGGGINGAGIARDLARRGASVGLFEKTDFGVGATGASSGMIHGGIRYIKTDPSVSKLACLDSGYIQRIAQHLIFRIPFVAPQRSKVVLEAAEAYFEVYDRYQPLKRGKQHCRLSAEEVRELIPGIHPKIVGAVTTDEWGIDANRLNLINAIDAAEAGAEIKPYHQVTGFLHEAGTVRGVKVRDRLGGGTREVFGKLVLNATGAWATRTFEMLGIRRKPLVRPGKGIHVIYPGRLTNYAIIASAIDGRDIFIAPQQNETWIGTTDDDYWGDLDDIPVLEDEIRYLVNGVASIFPVIREHRISRTIVGCRPTLYEYGKTESSLSREHELFDHGEDGAANFMTLGGGKLASYRVIAQEVADIVCKRLGIRGESDTHANPMPGGEDHDLTAAAFTEIGLDAYAANRILFRHGSRAHRILEMMRSEPRTRAIVDADEPVTEAELRHVIRKELVQTLDDCSRRCRLGYGPSGGLGAALRAAQIFCEEQGLAASDAPDVARAFAAERWAARAGTVFGGQLAQEELGQGTFHLNGVLGAAETTPVSRGRS